MPVKPAPVTKTVEDYLTIVWKAQEWPGDHATTTGIAATLGVTASTVSANLKKLARDGLLEYEPYGTPTLTEEGRSLAVPVIRRHRLIETYLTERLGLTWDEVHDEADLLEHAVSDRLLARIDQALGYPTRDPHGDAIPAADGTVTRTEAISLLELAPGAAGLLVRVSDREPDILRHLHDLGITLDSRLTVVKATDATGSMQVRSGDGQAVTLPAPVAAAIWVHQAL